MFGRERGPFNSLARDELACGAVSGHTQRSSGNVSTQTTVPTRDASASATGLRVADTFNLIFRADFINATNTPQFFSGPVTDVNSGNFGRISGAMDQSNLPRFIQFSLKLRF